MFDTHDTIAAPATASGGAVAMIRISGPEAIAVCDRIFRGAARRAAPPANTGRIGRRTDGGRPRDGVLATVIRPPPATRPPPPPADC